jgi:hypothetical protein
VPARDRLSIMENKGVEGHLDPAHQGLCECNLASPHPHEISTSMISHNAETRHRDTKQPAEACTAGIGTQGSGTPACTPPESIPILTGPWISQDGTLSCSFTQPVHPVSTRASSEDTP